MIVTRIVRCLFTALAAVGLFGLLGSFYTATEQTVLTNLLVWTGLIAIAYFAVLGLNELVFVMIEKAFLKPFIFDGFAICSGFIGVLLMCLALIKDPNDSLFVSIFTGVLAGLFAIFQLSLEIHQRANRKKEKDRIEP